MALQKLHRLGTNCFHASFPGILEYFQFLAIICENYADTMNSITTGILIGYFIG